MIIIEIEPLSNGGHRNCTISSGFENVPEGWAKIPENMEVENFPFGEVEAAEVDGVMTVIKWTAGTIPEPVELEEETQTGVGEVEQLRADVDYIAVMTGVEL